MLQGGIQKKSRNSSDCKGVRKNTAASLKMPTNMRSYMLFEEFAYALDIDRSEVVEYIKKHIA